MVLTNQMRVCACVFGEMIDLSRYRLEHFIQRILITITHQICLNRSIICSLKTPWLKSTMITFCRIPVLLTS